MFYSFNILQPAYSTLLPKSDSESVSFGKLAIMAQMLLQSEQA